VKADATSPKLSPPASPVVPSGGRGYQRPEAEESRKITWRECNPNPHVDHETGEGCTYCHDTTPDKTKDVFSEPIDLSGTDISARCLRCHEDEYHPAGHDHLLKPSAKMLIHYPYKSFPLDGEGTITCATCHPPHFNSWSGSRVDIYMELCPECHKR
jgi:hypothetical protein